MYSRKWEKLTDLNEYMLKEFMKFLGIDIPFYRLSDYDFTSQKSDLVLDMCREMKADLYIFGTQGKDYADIAAFNAANIQVYFQEYEHPVYTQLHGDKFSSHISALDLLFNHGEDSHQIIKMGNVTRDSLKEIFFGEEVRR